MLECLADPHDFNPVSPNLYQWWVSILLIIVNFERLSSSGTSKW